MLIILIKERQVWINRMQMRVRHIDLRVQGGQSRNIKSVFDFARWQKGKINK